ncbi:DJ-1/PfpI family protein [Candidatus Micrarchaeota archaeon]|nr:DJ-1/PfpI family protein [Candidatus Micrarchaeota archaeon]
MRAVLVIPQKDFQDEEYFEPRKTLEREGIITFIACKEKTGATSSKKALELPNMRLEEIQTWYLHGILIVGGPGCEQYYNDDYLFKIIRQFAKENRIIAASSNAIPVLANAGILDGKKVTGHPSVKNLVEAKGAKFTGAPVEVDGMIVTCKGPSEVADYSKRIADLIKQHYAPKL